jgi:hypothetical protein
VVVARRGRRRRVLAPRSHRSDAGGIHRVSSPGRSPFRRFERWLVGIFMAVLVFVLERLVMRQIKKKEHARSESSAAAVTLGED